MKLAFKNLLLFQGTMAACHTLVNFVNSSSQVTSKLKKKKKTNLAKSLFKIYALTCGLHIACMKGCFDQQIYLPLCSWKVLDVFTLQMSIINAPYSTQVRHLNY